MNIFWVVFSILYVGGCTFASLSIADAADLSSLLARALIAGFLFVFVANFPYRGIAAMIRKSNEIPNKDPTSPPTPAVRRFFSELVFPFLVVAGGSYLSMRITQEAPRESKLFTSFLAGSVCTGIAMIIAIARNSYATHRKTKQN
jgi:hypothetical protein